MRVSLTVGRESEGDDNGRHLWVCSFSTRVIRGTKDAIEFCLGIIL